MVTILVCGDRNWTNRTAIYDVLSKYPTDTILVHGAARGADSLAGSVGKELGWEVVEYAANWKEHGRAAGPIRNRKQFDETKPDLVIGFHNDIESSKGTKDMLNYAKSKG